MFELAFPGGREQDTEDVGLFDDGEDAFPGHTVTNDDDETDQEEIEEELISDAEEDNPVLDDDDLEDEG